MSLDHHLHHLLNRHLSVDEYRLVVKLRMKDAGLDLDEMLRVTVLYLPLNQLRLRKKNKEGRDNHHLE